MPYVWDSAKVDNYEELFEDSKKNYSAAVQSTARMG
jgi:hypothetical protein